MVHAFALTDIPQWMRAAELEGGGILDVRLPCGRLAIGLWPAWRTSAVSVSDSLKLAPVRRPAVRAATSATCSPSVKSLPRSHCSSPPASWSAALCSSVARIGLRSEQSGAHRCQSSAARWLDRAFEREFSQDVVARVRAIAGIEQVAVSHSAPIRWGGWLGTPVSVDGIGSSGDGRALDGWLRYFSTAGISIRKAGSFDR
jgi:hypothetical protein